MEPAPKVHEVGVLPCSLHDLNLVHDLHAGCDDARRWVVKRQMAMNADGHWSWHAGSSSLWLPFRLCTLLTSLNERCEPRLVHIRLCAPMPLIPPTKQLGAVPSHTSPLPWHLISPPHLLGRHAVQLLDNYLAHHGPCTAPPYRPADGTHAGGLPAAAAAAAAVNSKSAWLWQQQQHPQLPASISMRVRSWCSSSSSSSNPLAC